MKETGKQRQTPKKEQTVCNPSKVHGHNEQGPSADGAHGRFQGVGHQRLDGAEVQWENVLTKGITNVLVDQKQGKIIRFWNGVAQAAAASTPQT
jgi:hypothetical protein